MNDPQRAIDLEIVTRGDPVSSLLKKWRPLHNSELCYKPLVKRSVEVRSGPNPVLAVFYAHVGAAYAGSTHRQVVTNDGSADLSCGGGRPSIRGARACVGCVPWLCNWHPDQGGGRRRTRQVRPPPSPWDASNTALIIPSPGSILRGWKHAHSRWAVKG